jgi:hypothetical protein
VRRFVLPLLAIATIVALVLALGLAPGLTGGIDGAGSPVVGVVTAVDSAGLANVRSFTIRTTDGRSLSFSIGRLENPTEFPPGHLGEHLASGQPVRVWFRDEAGGNVAYRLEDA